jgi:hypothetical protein
METEEQRQLAEIIAVAVRATMPVDKRGWFERWQSTGLYVIGLVLMLGGWAYGLSVNGDRIALRIEAMEKYQVQDMIDKREMRKDIRDTNDALNAKLTSIQISTAGMAEGFDFLKRYLPKMVK